MGALDVLFIVPEGTRGLHEHDALPASEFGVTKTYSLAEGLQSLIAAATLPDVIVVDCHARNISAIASIRKQLGDSSCGIIAILGPAPLDNTFPGSHAAQDVAPAMQHLRNQTCSAGQVATSHHIETQQEGQQLHQEQASDERHDWAVPSWDNGLAALAAGASDFVLRPYDTGELQARMMAQVSLRRGLAEQAAAEPSGAIVEQCTLPAPAVTLTLHHHHQVAVVCANAADIQSNAASWGHATAAVLLELDALADSLAKEHQAQRVDCGAVGSSWPVSVAAEADVMVLVAPGPVGGALMFVVGMEAALQADSAVQAVALASDLVRALQAGGIGGTRLNMSAAVHVGSIHVSAITASGAGAPPPRLMHFGEGVTVAVALQAACPPGCLLLSAAAAAQLPMERDALGMLRSRAPQKKVQQTGLNSSTSNSALPAAAAAAAASGVEQLQWVEELRHVGRAVMHLYMAKVGGTAAPQPKPPTKPERRKMSAAESSMAVAQRSLSFPPAASHHTSSSSGSRLPRMYLKRPPAAATLSAAGRSLSPAGAPPSLDYLPPARAGPSSAPIPALPSGHAGAGPRRSRSPSRNSSRLSLRARSFIRLLAENGSELCSECIHESCPAINSGLLRRLSASTSSGVTLPMSSDTSLYFMPGWANAPTSRTSTDYRSSSMTDTRVHIGTSSFSLGKASRNNSHGHGQMGDALAHAMKKHGTVRASRTFSAASNPLLLSSGNYNSDSRSRTQRSIRASQGQYPSGNGLLMELGPSSANSSASAGGPLHRQGRGGSASPDSPAAQALMMKYAELNSLEDYQNCIPQPNALPAPAVFAIKEESAEHACHIRRDGQPAVELGVQCLEGTAAVDVARGGRSTLNNLQDSSSPSQPSQLELLTAIGSVASQGSVTFPELASAKSLAAAMNSKGGMFWPRLTRKRSSEPEHGAMPSDNARLHASSAGPSAALTSLQSLLVAGGSRGHCGPASPRAITSRRKPSSIQDPISSSVELWLNNSLGPGMHAPVVPTTTGVSHDLDGSPRTSGQLPGVHRAGPPNRFSLHLDRVIAATRSMGHRAVSSDDAAGVVRIGAAGVGDGGAGIVNSDGRLRAARSSNLEGVQEGLASQRSSLAELHQKPRSGQCAVILEREARQSGSWTQRVGDDARTTPVSVPQSDPRSLSKRASLSKVVSSLTRSARLLGRSLTPAGLKGRKPRAAVDMVAGKARMGRKSLGDLPEEPAFRAAAGLAGTQWWQQAGAGVHLGSPERTPQDEGGALEPAMPRSEGGRLGDNSGQTSGSSVQTAGGGAAADKPRSLKKRLMLSLKHVFV